VGASSSNKKKRSKKDQKSKIKKNSQSSKYKLETTKNFCSKSEEDV
jgi:hypothetical protein